jgi:hypothetical protein
VKERQPQIGEHLRRQPLGFLLRGPDLQAVLLVDRGAHDERLAPRLGLVPHQVVRPPPLRRGLCDPGLHRLAAGGHLVQHRDVQVAVVRHGEGTRDRRRGHDQDVRRRALLLEGDALMQAEPVLLVDDSEGEVGELHALLHQRVGPDEDVHLAGRDGRHDPVALLPGDRGRQQRVHGPIGPRLRIEERRLRRIAGRSWGAR